MIEREEEWEPIFARLYDPWMVGAVWLINLTLVVDPDAAPVEPD